MIIAPLFCMQSKTKKFIYNLNVYRNAHYRTLHKVKIEYASQVSDQIKDVFPMDRISLTYILYPKTRRRTDLANVLSIHDKFFCDALVSQGKLPDDDYTHVIQTTYKFGKVDKENPRVEILITQET